MSKDNKDFRIPDSLEAKILNKEIISIVYTNTERCTLGVIEATCIMINIEVVVIPYSDREIGLIERCFLIQLNKICF